MTATGSGWWMVFAILTVMVDTVLVQISLGINSIVFPLTLESLGFSKTLIGLILSVEVFAIVSVSRSISRLISRFGLSTVLLALPPVRAGLLVLLGSSGTWWAWMILVFWYGLATNVFLVALQTWLNTIPLEHSKGLVIGAYSASLSAGVALGPVVVHVIAVDRPELFKVNALICLLSWLPVIGTVRLVPRLTTLDKPRVLFIIRHASVIMAAAFVGGFTWFGLPAFLTLFGVGSGLTTVQASFLLPMFMFGSMTLGWAISWLSDTIDRSRVVSVCVFLSLLCSAYAPMIIYEYRVALLLFYLWGGLMGGIYAVCLTMVGEMFRMEDQVSANITYVLMDASGGFIGVFLIGLAMDFAGQEGLAYVLVSASICYFIFALSRHRAE